MVNGKWFENDDFIILFSRVAFVYIKALTQEGDEVPSSRLAITPKYFLLNKLCFDSKVCVLVLFDY